MCFQTDSRPPILPMAGAAVDSRDLELAAVDGNRFSAMAALASERPEAGILILPDIRGLHPYYEELALRFAEAGLDAVAIDY
ncbi:MAG: dienelactone hydrolase family protein, partial [Chloroflexota bacterium]|nr:dienelactone hydrolase family protein [Chloroflexota bacterium]